MSQSQTAEILWWLSCVIGLVWWPGQLIAVLRKKTSYEHSIWAWIFGTVGQLLAMVSGWLYESSAIFWTMAMYLALHFVMLGLVVYYRKYPGNAQ